MPYADSGGVRLYYEEVGKGTPIVFVHEFADDLRSWEPQMRYFSRRYRCIAYNARGYPPSDVPERRVRNIHRLLRPTTSPASCVTSACARPHLGCSMAATDRALRSSPCQPRSFAHRDRRRLRLRSRQARPVHEGHRSDGAPFRGARHPRSDKALSDRPSARAVSK